MCYSELNNAKRNFRIVEKTYNHRGNFPSNKVFYVQFSRTAPHTDCWHTLKAFCSYNVDQARESAELLLSILQQPGYIEKPRITQPAVAAVEEVEIPQVTEAPQDIDLVKLTYAEMKQLITDRGLNIKKNLSAADMRSQIAVALLAEA